MNWHVAAMNSCIFILFLLLGVSTCKQMFIYTVFLNGMMIPLILWAYKVAVSEHILAVSCM